MGNDCLARFCDGRETLKIKSSGWRCRTFLRDEFECIIDLAIGQSYEERCSQCIAVDRGMSVTFLLEEGTLFLGGLDDNLRTLQKTDRSVDLGKSRSDALIRIRLLSGESYQIRSNGAWYERCIGHTDSFLSEKSPTETTRTETNAS